MQTSQENGEFPGPEYSLIRDQIFLNKVERVPIIMQDLVESVRKAGSGDMLGALVTQTSAILELAGMLQVVVKDVITHQNVCQKYRDDYEKMGMRVKTVEKKLQLLEYYQKHKKFDTASVGINTEEISFPQSSSLSEPPFPVSSESPAPFVYHQVISENSHQNVYRIRPRKSRTSSLSSLSRSDSPSNSYPIPSGSISPECNWSHQTLHCKSPQILLPHSTLEGSEQYTYHDISQTNSLHDTSSVWQESYFPSPYNDDLEDYDMCDQQNNHSTPDVSQMNPDSTLNQEEPILNENNLGLIINNVCSLREDPSFEKLTVYDWVDDDLTSSGGKTTGFLARNKKAKLVTANYLKNYPYSHIINTKMKKKSRKKKYKSPLINCPSPVLCKSKNSRVIPYYKKSLQQRQKWEMVPNVRKSLRIRIRKLTNVVQVADDTISSSKTKENSMQLDGNSILAGPITNENNNSSTYSVNGHSENLSESIPFGRDGDKSIDSTKGTQINEVTTLSSESVENSTTVLPPNHQIQQKASEKEITESENVMKIGNPSCKSITPEQTATGYIPAEVKSISNKIKDMPIDTQFPVGTTEVNDYTKPSGNISDATYKVTTLSSESMKNPTTVLSPNHKIQQKTSEKEITVSENVMKIGNSSSENTNPEQTVTEYIPAEVKSISNQRKASENISEVTHKTEIMVPQERNSELGNFIECLNLKQTLSEGKQIDTLKETNLPSVKIILKDVMKLNNICEHSENLKIDKIKQPKTSKTKSISDSVMKIKKEANGIEKRKKIIKKVTNLEIKREIMENQQETASKPSINKNPNNEGETISSEIFNTLVEEHTLRMEVMGPENINELIQSDVEIHNQITDNSEEISTNKVVCVSDEKRALSDDVVGREITEENKSSCKEAEDELLTSMRQSDEEGILLGNLKTYVQEVFPDCKELVSHDIREENTKSQKEIDILPLQESSMKGGTSVSKETSPSSIENKVLNDKKDEIVSKEKEIFDSKQCLNKKDNIQCLNEDENEAKLSSVSGTHSINLSIADMARLLDSGDDDNSNKEYVFVSSDLANVDSTEQVFVFETAEAIKIHPQNVIEDENSTSDSSLTKPEVQEKMSDLKMNVVENIPETAVIDVPDVSTNMSAANGGTMQTDHFNQSSSQASLKQNEHETKSTRSSKERNDAEDSSLINVDGESNNLVSQPVQSFTKNFENESIKNICPNEANVSSMDIIQKSEVIVSKISNGIPKHFEKKDLVSASKEIENSNNLELTHSNQDSTESVLIQAGLQDHKTESIGTKSITIKLNQFSRISPISFHKEQSENISIFMADTIDEPFISEASNQCNNIITEAGSKDTDLDLVSKEVRCSLDQSVSDVNGHTDTLMIKSVESLDDDSKNSKEKHDKTNKVLQDVTITDGNSEADQMTVSTTTNFETNPEEKTEDQTIIVENMAAFLNPTTETDDLIQAQSDHSNLIPNKKLTKNYSSKHKDFSSRSKKALSSLAKHPTATSNDLINHQVHLNLEPQKFESSHHHFPLTSDNPTIEFSQSLFNSDTLFIKSEKTADNLISQQAKSTVDSSHVNIDHLEVLSPSSEEICQEVIPKKFSDQKDHIVDQKLKGQGTEDSSKNDEYKEFQNFCCDDDDEISFKNVPWMDNSAGFVSQILTGYVSDVEDDTNNTGRNFKKGLKYKNHKKHKHLNENSKPSSQIKTRSVKQPDKPETSRAFGGFRKKMKNSSQLPDGRKLTSVQTSEINMPVSQVTDEPGQIMHHKSSALIQLQSKAIVPQGSLVNSSAQVHSLCASKPGSAIIALLESKASTKPDNCTLFTSDESDTSESLTKVSLKWISNDESSPGNSTRQQYLPSHKSSLDTQIMEQLESLKDATSSSKLDDPSLLQNNKLSQSIHEIDQQTSKLSEKQQTKGKRPQAPISTDSTENSLSTLKSSSMTSNHLQIKKKHVKNSKKFIANNFSKGIFGRKKLKNGPKSKKPKTDQINSKKLVEECPKSSDVIAIWKKLEILKEENQKIVKFKTSLYKQVAEIAIPHGFAVVRSIKGVVVSRGLNPIFRSME